MKVAKTVSCVYLYGDGHAVEIHEEYHAKSGATHRWAEIHENWGPKVRLPAGPSEAALEHGQGRITIHVRWNRGLVSIIRNAKEIRAHSASVERGSENTRRKGIVVGTFDIHTKDGNLSLDTFPNEMVPDLLYQEGEEYTSTFKGYTPENIRTWGTHNVHKVHRVGE